MQDEVLTLTDIENGLDTQPDTVIPVDSAMMPKDRVLPLSDAIKTYTYKKDFLEKAFATPTPSLATKIAYGASQVAQGFIDIDSKLNAMIVRAFNGHTMPNMTEEQAAQYMENVTRSIYANKAAFQTQRELEGLTDDFMSAENLSAAFASGLAYGGIALAVASTLATAGLAAPIAAAAGGAVAATVGGVQAATDKSQEWAEKYWLENYGMRGYKGAKDAIYATAHGAISGWIEKKLGVENLLTKALIGSGLKDAAKYVGKGIGGAVVRSSASEYSEEFLQGMSGWLFGKLADGEDRTFGEAVLDEAATAVYGGLMGAAFGGGVYYGGRRKLAKTFKKAGFSTEDSLKLAQSVLDEGQNSILQELNTVSSLRSKIGSPFDSLVTKIDSALASAGWTDTDPFVILEDGRIERKSAIEEGTAYTEASRLDYATYVASDIAGQVLRQADKAQVPTSDILNLAEIEVHGNIISLKPQKLRTSKQIKSKIESVNADLKTARAELRAENAKKTTLQTDPKRVEQLRGIINDLTTKKGILQQLLTSKQSIEKAQDVVTERKKQQIGLDTAQSFKDAKTVAKKQSATEFTKSISKKDATVDAKTAQKRYNNAVVAWLCDGDTRLFDQLMTSNGMTVKAIESIVQYGQQIIAFDAAHPELGLRADMQNALSRMLEMKHKGEFKQFVQQDGTFAENALMYNMVFAQHTGDISAFLQSYIQRAETPAKSQAELHNSTQIRIQIFDLDVSFTSAQAKEYADKNINEYPADPSGYGYDSKDFARAVSDELHDLRGESVGERYFDKNDPIRKLARDWLQNNEQGNAYFLKAQESANELKQAELAESGQATIETKTQFTKDDLLFQTLKEIYPTQFDGDTAIDKDLVAVFVSQNNQQLGEIVNQTDTTNVVDLTKSLQNVQDDADIETTVKNYIESLFNKVMKTKTEPLKITIKGKTKHIIKSNINLKGQAKQQHNAALMELERLINNSIKTGQGPVDLGHNTNRRTVAFKKNANRFVYFSVPVKIGNNNFVVEFATAEMKGQDPEILSLYNVAVKKQATTSSSNALSPESNAIMQPETPVVKQLNQRTQANGMYDPELNVIVLGRNFNTTTLPHELSHFWLNNTFQLFKQAQKGYPVAQEWLDETQRLFDILGIDANQDTLTREQQENWASMNEAIITGLANVPDGATLPITGYLNWIPEKYKSLLNIGYRDKNGKVVYPILDKAAMDFFNVWYGNITLPALPTSPAREQASNPVSESGETVPSTPQVIKERTEQINKAIKDQTDADKALYESAVDELPTETRAGINAEYTKYDDVSGLTVEKLPEDKGWFKQGKRHQRDEMIKKAREYVKKNAEHAREVALMGKPALNDTGIDLETLILAVMEFDKVDSKSDLGFRYMHNIAMTRSEAGTTLGLHAQDGSYQTYLDGYRRLTAAMTESAAYKYAGRGADSITKFNNDVEALCAKYADAVDNGSMSREQALKALVAEASVKFAGEEDTTILNQLDLTQAGKTREAFVEYAKRLVRRDIAKAEPDTKMQGKLLALAPQAEKASQDLNSKNPATASAAAKKMREWSELVHSADPRQTMLSGAINSYAPRAMLSGISTHVTNIFSNTAEQAMLRPAIAAHYGKNIVPQADIDAEKARIKAVYDATFMNLTSMITPTDPTLVHGEKYKPLDPDAKGWQKVYDAPMRALAAEDNWFRIPTYLDIAARMASRDANGDVNKAKELFKQYTSTQPKKINGKENPLYAKRAEIVTMSAFATFTQNGKLAGALNKMRDGLNSLSVGGYELQLGTLIAPFIKTPANIIASGLRSPFGAGVTLYKKLAGKEISFQDAADTAHFIGLAMLALLAGAFCDYEEPYKGGKYNPNKPYDSIGIGGYWLKLNALGVLEAPMRVFMSALHGGQVEILETVGSVPLIGELVDNRLNYATKNPTGWAAGTVYNQANKLIPTLVKQVAKPIIKSTGAETDIESIDLGFKTGIGGKIERTWGLDGIDPTINDWLGIVFNRIKITD